MIGRLASRVRRLVAVVSHWGLITGALSVLVVGAMVAVAVISRESADVHRRAQVLAERVRAAAHELSALKWRANSEVLGGTADLSSGGVLVGDGGRVIADLGDQVARLQRLQPGSEADQLRFDVQKLYVSGLQQLAAARGPKPLSRTTLAAMQASFQPLLDRMDRDAQLTAERQQEVAARALDRSLAASIGSLLLGVGALASLGWYVARLRRRTMLAARVRAIERRSDQRLRALVEHSTDVVSVLGRDLRVRWQAASVRRLLGHEPGSLVQAPILSFVHPEDRASFDGFLRARFDDGAPATLRARLRHADGRWRYLETIAENRFDDPAVEGLVLNMRDVTDRRQFEQELRHQAFHDALTGLANRDLFDDRLRHAIAGILRMERAVAVLFLDLDDFKTLNDSLGHRAGDALLKVVATRILALVRPNDTAARLGGDEFAVLLDGVQHDDEAHGIAARVLEALTDPFTIDERELRVTASIGIAFSDGSVQAEDILRNADMAMYAAKQRGKGSIQAFEQRMHHRALKRLELGSELQRALANHEFELDYQPIVSLQTGCAVGVEALVRWRHPSRGRLAPDQFVALAEETGLIVSLGQWILQQACAQTREWQLARAATKPLFVSVNVSVRQLCEYDFPQIVAGVLARTALKPESLVLEITEGMLADDREVVIRQLQLLKQLGLRIAIDDFGTGYSALSQLQHLPVDLLKIDKSFIDVLDSDPENANLARVIVNLGKSLRLDVIAEGIEELEQADRLRAMNSGFGQGFLYCRPIRPKAVMTILDTLGSPLELETR